MAISIFDGVNMYTDKIKFQRVLKWSKWAFAITFATYFTLLNFILASQKILGYSTPNPCSSESADASGICTVFYGVLNGLDSIVPYSGWVFWVAILSFWLSTIYMFVFGLAGLIIDIRRKYSWKIESKSEVIDFKELNTLNFRELLQSNVCLFLIIFTAVSTFLNLTLFIWPSFVFIFYYMRLLAHDSLAVRLENVIPLSGWFLNLMFIALCISIVCVVLNWLIKAGKGKKCIMPIGIS